MLLSQGIATQGGRWIITRASNTMFATHGLVEVVPEPTMLACFTYCATTMLRRRRKSRP
jgi:hypothetical protein